MILIKLNFIIILVLYLYLFKKLISKPFGFSLGIIFGVLFFIFTPLSILVSTDILEISKMDFHNTNLHDILLKDNIFNSVILLSYLYSILIYTFLIEFYLPKKHTIKRKKRKKFPIKWKQYLLIALSISIFIFLMSGIQNGGNWYINRSNFFKESGFLGLILVDSFAAFKIIFITAIILAFNTRKISKKMFFLTIILFSVSDIVITGNRIYVFIIFSLLFLSFIKKHGMKVVYLFIFLIPIGYIMSIYRHIRGKIFIDGIPSLNDFFIISIEIIKNNPPNISDFLLGISESVNLNVIYQTFDYITLETLIWGETFLKTFVFFVPRSIWNDKPISITQIAGHYYAPQAEHLSLVTTLIGEVHINFYIFGILLLPVILFFTKKLLTSMFNNGEFESIILFIIALLLFRMPYSDIILISFFVFLYYKIILNIKKVKFK